jgi:hypothetical protein
MTIYFALASMNLLHLETDIKKDRLRWDGERRKNFPLISITQEKTY